MPSTWSTSSVPDALGGGGHRPDARLRRRDGFGLTDPRFTTREVLSEIHYCVLCHERDKDTCSKGIRDKSGQVTENALGIKLPGCPLDEKISEMHTARKRGDAIGALAIVTVDNPMCPGHRAPHLQRLHESLHLPEAGAGEHPTGGDGRAHRCAEPAVRRRDLRIAHALEPAQHRPAVLPPVQRPQRARGRPRPRRLYPVALPPQRGLRRGGDRRTQDRGAARRHRRRPSSPAASDPRLVRDLPAARRACAGGVWRRLRVWHHGALGQELPDAHPPHTGAPGEVQGLRRRALRRRAANRGSVGRTASITWRLRRAPGDRRSSTSGTT